MEQWYKENESPIGDNWYGQKTEEIASKLDFYST